MLFITQQLPWPLNSGGNIRTYYVLKALSSRFEISLIATARDASQATAGRDALAPFCKSIDVVQDRKVTAAALLASIATSLLRGTPAFVQHNTNSLLRDCVREQIRSKRFDVVHLNHLDTVPYVGLAKGIPHVIDTHNVMHAFFARRSKLERNLGKRLFFRMEAAKLKQYELRAFRQANKVLVCSNAEKDSLLKLEPGLEIAVIPNGVDCDYFGAIHRALVLAPNLVFVGDMTYRPNHDGIMEFVRDVLPLITARFPKARLVVVGKNPLPELREIAATRPEITITGFVDDTREYVRQARVFVVPLRYGSGTRLKVLEAFSSGIPLVSTAVGAEGIDYRDGEDILIADDAGDMSAAICRLLEDEELCRRLGQNGRRIALERYDWKRIGQDLLEFYEWL